jgi:hypothetical protein
VLKRRFRQALVALTLSATGVIVAAAPAQASVVVQPHASGNACSDYKYITSTLYFQACVWASGGVPEERVWFTGHFGNTANSAVRVNGVDLSFYQSGEHDTCNYSGGAFVLAAHSIRASADDCFIPRARSAFQADVQASYGGRWYEQVSPTLQVL